MADRVLLSQVVGRPLVGPAGDRIGRTADLVVRLADGGAPIVTGVVRQAATRETFVPREDLARLGPTEVRLGVDRIGTRPFAHPVEEGHGPGRRRALAASGRRPPRRGRRSVRYTGWLYLTMPPST